MATATKAKKNKTAAPKQESKARAARPVIVFTSHRGVFFGQSSDPIDAKFATVSGVRNCIFWHSSVGGVLGLAQSGPNGQCRIGKKSDGPIGLQDVTGIIECTPEAAAAWESAAVYTGS